MAAERKRTFRSDFRQFFLKGLAVLLPTVLTIWILVTVYQFVDQKIAEPINTGVQELILRWTPWPEVEAYDRQTAGRVLTAEERRQAVEQDLTAEERRQWRAARAADNGEAWLNMHVRREALEKMWGRVSIGNWAVLDLIGLLIAAVLIYMAGLLLGSYIGRHIYRRGEELLRRMPIFRQIYPYVKQVTDFLVGDSDEKIQFNRVVAVQYPRRGLWSVGLVTGDTMRVIQDSAKTQCVTVFIPSSPTPFTGYVITVPAEDTIELPISIDDALRFTVSGGVIVPPNQVIDQAVPAGARSKLKARPEGAALIESSPRGDKEPPDRDRD